MPTSQDITFTAPDGEVPALLVAPDAGTGPGMVLVQEIFGVNQYIRDVAERLAGEGYAVLAPHMYWRIEDDFAVEAAGPDDLPTAFAVAGQHQPEQGITDLGAAIDHLAGRAEVTGPVGIIGFCFGGSMAYLTAAHHEPACAVAYYGSMIGSNLDVAGGITCPTQFHFGDADDFLPNDDVEALRAATADRDGIEIIVQPGAGHAFDNHRNPMFSNPDAAAASWQRTSAFLAAVLKN